MTKELAHYRQIERRLWMARWINEGQEAPEEDAILDEMEETWLRLSDEEQDLLRQELAGGPYTLAPVPWVYEGFHSPLDAILDAEAA